MQEIFSFDTWFNAMVAVNDFYWQYIGWLLVVGAGAFLTVYSKGFQFRAIYNFRANMKKIYQASTVAEQCGVNPFKLYFASVGGMIGLGNIVTISGAIMLGGPGSIFWMLIASIFGMLMKYSEIYLGVKYRIKNNKGGYDGGPMYFLQHAFGYALIPSMAAFLICLYGVEIYNFVVLVDRLEHSFDMNRNLVIFGLLALILYISVGGVKRLATVCSFIMPVFMIAYILLALFVIIDHAGQLPTFFNQIFASAFTGYAPVGGFVGSSLILMSHVAISKTIYSGDIGIGYDSIVQSETKVINPQTQATLAVYALMTDTFICLLTNFMLGVTGAWQTLNHLPSSDIVPTILNDYLAFSDLFITLLLFFAGLTTIIAYLAAGSKCAHFLNPKYGKFVYFCYASVAFVLFADLPQDNVLKIMEFLSGILVFINVIGILKLRKNINFS